METPVAVRGNDETARALMRKHAMLTCEADTDGDGRLSFDEFVNSVPEHVRRMRSPEELKAWFGLIDTDGSGMVTMDEFFSWSLSAASLASGSGVIKAFERYDTDSSGTLTVTEALSAIQEMGYGANAYEVVRLLPTTPAGNIDYLALIDKGGLGLSGDERGLMRSFVTSMAWDSLEDVASPIDTSGWKVTAQDPEGIREQIVALLTQHSVRFADLYETIDTSDDQQLNFQEFANAMQQLFGYEGPDDSLQQIYSYLDNLSANDNVHFNELNAWISGRIQKEEASVAAALRLTLGPRVSEDDDEWTAERLRYEMLQMLEEAALRVEHLFKAWDSDNGHALSKKEYLVHFRRLVGREKEHLWYTKVRQAVTETFKIFDREENGHIDIDEMRKWLEPPQPLSAVESQVVNETAEVVEKQHPMLCSPKNIERLASFVPPAPPTSRLVRQTETTKGSQRRSREAEVNDLRIRIRCRRNWSGRKVDGASNVVLHFQTPNTHRQAPPAPSHQTANTHRQAPPAPSPLKVGLRGGLPHRQPPSPRLSHTAAFQPPNPRVPPSPSTPFEPSPPTSPATLGQPTLTVRAAPRLSKRHARLIALAKENSERWLRTAEVYERWLLEQRNRIPSTPASPRSGVPQHRAPPRLPESVSPYASPYLMGVPAYHRPPPRRPRRQARAVVSPQRYAGPPMELAMRAHVPRSPVLTRQ